MDISSSWGLLFMVCYCIFAMLLLAREDTIGKKKVFDEVRLRYEQALTELKTDPTNADLLSKVFARGREYASLAREFKGISVFDETVLTGDINRVLPETMKIPKPPIRITADDLNYQPHDAPSVLRGVALGAALITAGAGFFVMALMNPEDIIGICLFAVMGIMSILMGILTIITVFNTRSQYDASIRYIAARRRLIAERPELDTNHD
ncbi:MAG: hypothetical protein WA821_02480 [Anaerolineales bacterium]